jgi:phage-related protein
MANVHLCLVLLEELIKQTVLLRQCRATFVNAMGFKDGAPSIKTTQYRGPVCTASEFELVR